MIRIKMAFFFFVAIALAQTPSTVNMGPGTSGTGHEIMGGSVKLKSGAVVRYKSIVSGRSATSNDLARGLGEGGLSFNDDHIHRIMANRVKGVYFGYDLDVVPLGSANDFAVTFSPPTKVAPLLERVHEGQSMTLLPLPKYPESQVVHDGDTIELDLMVSPDGRQRVTDYIEILSHEPEPPAATTTAEPRDFTVDDGPVNFDFSRITVWKQGQRLNAMGSDPPTQGGSLRGSFAMRAGATFWITFPGQGRYIASLVPHDGFSKTGAVRDNVIFFEEAGQEYQVRFMSPIAGARKAWNLYVQHDPTYEAEAHRTSIDLGVDRLDRLLAAQ